MKTIYTLLLAFGLCFTVHAQSVLNFNSASSQIKNQVETLQQGNINRLLFQSGFSTKHLSNDNQGIKLIKIVNSNSIDNNILVDYGANYSNVKAIVFSDIKNTSSIVEALDLTGFNSLEYVVIDAYEALSNAFIQNLLQNVQLPLNVTIVYKHNVLM